MPVNRFIRLRPLIPLTRISSTGQVSGKAFTGTAVIATNAVPDPSVAAPPSVAHFLREFHGSDPVIGTTNHRSWDVFSTTGGPAVISLWRITGLVYLSWQRPQETHPVRRDRQRPGRFSPIRAAANAIRPRAWQVNPEWNAASPSGPGDRRV